MAQKLLKRGHQVTMVCGSYGPSDTGLCHPFARGRREGIVDGIRVIEFDLSTSNKDGFLKRTWVFLRYSLRSSWLAVIEPSDLIFATSTPLTAAIPAIVARWFRGRRFVFEVRDLWPELPKAMGIVKNPLLLAAMGLLERTAYRNASACIGLAPGIVEGITRHVHSEKVMMIPNGCDVEFFEDASVAAWRPAEICPEDFLAVFAGTHGQANGLDAVLDVASELLRRGRGDIKFLLVGDGKKKSKLQQRAAAEAITSVIFHKHVPKDRIAGLLASADVGLQILANVPAFYYGTSPNKFFDYLAAGLPVVTNYPGWVAELVSKHECGKAVPANNAGAFADALEWLADNRGHTEQMGCRARRLAIEEFHRNKLSDHFVDLLETTAGR
jgi:glycosyltransferase involved in cell wall biosynthesis